MQSVPPLVCLGTVSAHHAFPHDRMLAKLIPVDGSPAIVIQKAITLVGRKKGLCDIHLDHTSISKVHCAIARTDGLLYIRDLGSTNGTKVNGQRVTRGALLPGDELAFAKIKFQVHLGPGDSQAMVPTHERTEALEIFRPQDQVQNEEFAALDNISEAPSDEYIPLKEE
jgi:pSer/pThr/pTyr-binding forkhead associated (FHA) protein